MTAAADLGQKSSAAQSIGNITAHTVSVTQTVYSGESTDARASPFYSVPPRNPNFVGRNNVFAAIHEMLIESNATAITQAAIYGLGGIGKTSIAAEYCHRFAGSYRGVWWAPAEHRSQLIASLAQLGKELGVSYVTDEFKTEKSAENKALEMAHATLRAISGNRQRYLLIYDNVESPSDILDLIPSGDTRLLITSRFADWGGIAKEIRVETLEMSNAVDFLINRTGQNDRSGARQLAESIGALPLALEHAAAFIKRTPGLTFDGYRREIMQYIEQIPRATLYTNSVAATFRIAIDAIARENSGVRQIMNYISFLDPDEIPVELIKKLMLPRQATDAALRMLSEFSLITNHQNYMATHRLVQLANRSQLDVAKSLAIIQYIAGGINSAAADALRYLEKRRHDCLMQQAIYVLNIAKTYDIEPEELRSIERLLGPRYRHEINIIQQAIAQDDKI